MENLFPLITQSQHYKLLITEKVERLIRYYCSEFPSNEWSGTLFYDVEGSFEDGSLKIIAKDFFLQDIGTTGFTVFQHDASLAGYMVDNNLFSCYTGLMHSHHSMQAFFSGTDRETLQSEGNEQNHFVSLIVNNKGKYVAQITRKVTYLQLNKTYETFGGNVVTATGEGSSIIEAFTLDIEIEDAIAARVKELKASVKSSVNTKIMIPKVEPITMTNPVTITDHSNDGRWSSIVKQPQQLELFNKEETQEEDDSKDIIADAAAVAFHSEYIESCARQLLTANFMSPLFKDFNKKAWVDKMHTVLSKRFGAPVNDAVPDGYKVAIDSMVETLAQETIDSLGDVDDEDMFLLEWATSVQDDLKEFGTNIYINYCIESLSVWIR